MALDVFDSQAETEPIRIGISSCLLGEEVRYNGGHKRNRYVTDILSQYFELHPYCPEVAIGLGVPRPAIRLETSKMGPRAIVQNKLRRDVTEKLSGYGQNIGDTATTISGYIFKARSPSCGMERVGLYDQNGVPSAVTSGIYARAIMDSQPLLPVEEEGRLNDPALRDNFLERVFVYALWQNMRRDGNKISGLVNFHTEHKFLIMAHNQEAMRQLGRIVANAAEDPEQAMQKYIELLMPTLRIISVRKSQANVLQHIAGFFKKYLDSNDRQELDRTIRLFARDKLPIIAPLTLIRHYQRKYPDSYLTKQHFPASPGEHKHQPVD